MNSGWDRKDTREMVVSGIRELRKMRKRRIEENDCQYRSAANLLVKRTRTKQVGKEDWFKKESEKRIRMRMNQDIGKRLEQMKENRKGRTSK